MAVVALLLALLVFAVPAGAHQGEPAPETRARALEEPCPGEEIKPDRVITGSFPSEMQGSHVMVPFTVPFGTTALRVKYCFDQPETLSNSQVRHTLDLGLFSARAGDELWDHPHFRGWGGSSHADVWVSPEGFTPEEFYTANPRGNIAGKTTRGYLPGPIQPGVWAAELGVASVATRDDGDTDGAVAWRLEVAFSTNPAHADEPYVPAAYDETPARSEAGWYAGDFHVHAEHSSLGDATMTEAFDYAFKDAKLDFVTLSDYVTRSGWGEIGRHQARYPGKLVTRSAEVITYRGHANNQTAVRYVDHRTGPVYELKPDGSLGLRREARSASALLGEIVQGGGFSQVNHPTIFPSEVPGFQSVCRGCPWDYDDAETDWSKVDAYEVHTGPAGFQEGVSGVLGPNPFTPLAVDEYERLLAAGHHVAAVAASDSHNGGRRNGPTQSPIGQGQAVVFAEELSEAGIRCGVQAGHTYAKVWGTGHPDVRLEATAQGVAGKAIFGDTVRASSVDFKASVIEGSGDYTLLVLKDGNVIHSRPASGDFAFKSSGPGRYGLRVMRGSSYEVVSTPIWVEDPGARAPGIVSRDCKALVRRSPRPAPKLRVSVRRVTVRKGAFLVRCRVTDGKAKRCSVVARSGKRVVGRGSAVFKRRIARVRVRLTRAGKRALRKGPLRVRLTARTVRGAAIVLDRREVVLRRAR